MVLNNVAKSTRERKQIRRTDHETMSGFAIKQLVYTLPSFIEVLDVFMEVAAIVYY